MSLGPDTVFPPGTAEDEKRFVMDYSMNKIAKYLRLLGYDVACNRRLAQRELIRVAGETGRCLLTCSPALAEHARAHLAAVARAREREQQHAAPRRVVAYDSDGDSVYSSGPDDAAGDFPLIEIRQWDRGTFAPTFIGVLRAAALQYRPARVFSRCVTCNHTLVAVPKEEVAGRVEATVFRIYNDFNECPECHKVFWGFDGDTVINFKAFRTLDLLRSICVSAGVRFGPGARFSRLACFRSFPRAVKQHIFSFLTDAELAAVAAVMPSMEQLTEEVLHQRRTGIPVKPFKHIKTAR